MRDIDKPGGPPLWVKIFFIVLTIVVIGIGTMMLVGGHGPWQHDPSVHSTLPGGNPPQ